MKGIKGVIIGILACLLAVRELNHVNAIAAAQENTRRFGESQLEIGQIQGKKEAEFALKEIYLSKLDSVRKVNDQALASLQAVYELAIDSCDEVNQKFKTQMVSLREGRQAALDSNQVLRNQVKKLKIQLEKRIKANTQTRRRPDGVNVTLRAELPHRHSFLSETLLFVTKFLLLMVPIVLGWMRLRAKQKLGIRLRKSFLR